MNFDLVRIWQQMDLFARCIVGALGTMAVASAAVFLERLWVFRRASGKSRAFATRATELLASHRHEDIVKEGEKQVHSPLAQLLAAGLKTFLKTIAEPAKAGPTAAILARREMERRSESLNAEIRRGM